MKIFSFIKSAVKYLAVVFIFIAAVIFAGCGSVKQISGVWNNGSIKIDGSQLDWHNKLNYFTDPPIALGVADDGNFLYVCFTTGNRAAVLQILRSGFTVGIEPEDNEKNYIAVQYPLERGRLADNEMPAGEGYSGRNSPRQVLDRLLRNQNEFLIMNKENFPLAAYHLNNNIGIEIKIGIKMEQFVYELKIPMQKDSAFLFALEIKPGDKIIVDLKTGDTHYASRPGFSGMFGGGGEFQRPDGRERSGSFAGKTEPLDFKAEVTLAGPNTILK